MNFTGTTIYSVYINASTGASLKLTTFKPIGHVWTMVAGGGASIVHSDSIAAADFAHKLANYGEYSGAPSEGQTFEYDNSYVSHHFHYISLIHI